MSGWKNVIGRLNKGAGKIAEKWITLILAFVMDIIIGIVSDTYSLIDTRVSIMLVFCIGVITLYMYNLNFENQLKQKLESFNRLSEDEVSNAAYEERVKNELSTFMDNVRISRYFLFNKRRLIDILDRYRIDEGSPIVRHAVYRTIGEIGGNYAYEKLAAITDSDIFADQGRQIAVEKLCHDSFKDYDTDRNL